MPIFIVKVVRDCASMRARVTWLPSDFAFVEFACFGKDIVNIAAHCLVCCFQPTHPHSLTHSLTQSVILYCTPQVHYYI